MYIPVSYVMYHGKYLKLFVMYNNIVLLLLLLFYCIVKERGYMQQLRIRQKIILKWVSSKYAEMAVTATLLFQTRTIGGLLRAT
jgi:hypothetical protein